MPSARPIASPRRGLGGVLGLLLAAAGYGAYAGVASCRSVAAEGDPVVGAVPSMNPALNPARPASTISSWPAASATADPGALKPGMAWVPAGTLRAGTPHERTPRIADEEMSGQPVEMGGFYIDLLPWPNEPNAIPTTNVSRDEAEQLCAAKNKRLCTELEWERACKGPENRTYEYGDAYRKEPCGTGMASEQASRRPTGEHAQCKSGFGVSEMHGGVWEWTSSTWGRGSRDGSQGVLRGGNSVAGELVGRCANAIARAPTKKAPTMGLRCCAGPRSAAEVKLELTGIPSLTLSSPAVAAGFAPTLAAAVDPAGASAIEPKTVHAWSWIPIPNEELVVVSGCSAAGATRACAVVVTRPAKAGADAGASNVLVSTITGRDPPEVAKLGDPRHLRIRSLDQRGTFSREVTYIYGRIDLGEPKRP